MEGSKHIFNDSGFVETFYKPYLFKYKGIIYYIPRCQGYCDCYRHPKMWKQRFDWVRRLEENDIKGFNQWIRDGKFPEYLCCNIWFNDYLYS